MLKRYEKFLNSRQESLRLSIALDAFFIEEDRTRREAYGAYLRRRIRSALEKLLAEEAFDKLEVLDALGWIGSAQIDDLIEIARKKQMTPGLVWLLNRKRERYGFRDRDFSL